RAASELTAALASGALTAAETGAALFLLGQAQADLGQTDTAVQTFRAQLGSPAPNPRSHFFLADLNQKAGNCAVAVTEYEAYLAAEPALGAYVYPRLANCLSDAGEITAVYEQALNAPANYLVEIANRRQLATRHLEAGNYAAAITQYATIRDLAQTEFTKGEMTYLIGNTYVLSGSVASGYDAYQLGVANYPRAYESYLGLVELVNAEQPVDEYQRGLVNFYAKSYQPSIDAFQRYLAANLTDYAPDTHLFLAWGYEAVGDVANALLHMDKFLATNPTDPETIGRYYTEKAELENRVVDTAVALNTLDEFIGQNPDHPLIPEARWRTAQFADRFMGDGEAGARRYRRYAEEHPSHEHAAEAWFRAGVLAQQAGQLPSAVEAWQTAATYEDEFAHAALLWLVTHQSPAEVEAYSSQILALPRTDYYAIRARDLVAGVPAYAPSAKWNVTEFDEAAEQTEAEAWIRTTFGLGVDTAVSSTLSPALANDPRLLRGTELWALGLKTEAKQELEALRIAYDDDPVASYQLALYFRDLGLYRSAIIAGSNVRWLAGASIYDAPRLLGRLSFPTYYADLITPSAEKYGYDPLLHFALLRQESLFESFITSSAAAQ
ncbi:MAG: tetratricopeptide repeat protein, partial [Anaerolineales bacterium]|nr:tetratricopeptide repeat protein [Anaerolineales bacterium]